jgi:uncharacterized protein HemY
MKMTDESLRTLRLLLARLERISALLRMLDQLEKGESVSGQEMKRLFEHGYSLLQRAVEEKIR